MRGYKAMKDATSPDCTMVALYGINANPTELERIYAALVDWFFSTNSPPDKLWGEPLR